MESESSRDTDWSDMATDAKTIEEINESYTAAYKQLQSIYGKWSVPLEVSFELSDGYKKLHRELIQKREEEREIAERLAKFEETHSERRCRKCNDLLPPPSGRGRPAVFCEKDRPVK